MRCHWKRGAQVKAAAALQVTHLAPAAAEGKGRRGGAGAEAAAAVVVLPPPSNNRCLSPPRRERDGRAEGKRRGETKRGALRRGAGPLVPPSAAEAEERAPPRLRGPGRAGRWGRSSEGRPTRGLLAASTWPAAGKSRRSQNPWLVRGCP